MIEPVDYVDQMLAQQPTRSGKTKAPRRFDQTQLRAGHHGKYVHRDYAAHFFRWGWVSRHIKRSARILDVGCGQDLPLVWTLSGNISVIPQAYVGVDLNGLDSTGTPKWAHLMQHVSFVDEFTSLRFSEFVLNTVPEDAPTSQFDYITNFEVIEHMSVEDGKKMLTGFHYWLKPEGKVFLSTPVFNRFAAKNHVHEYTIPELQEIIELQGFKVAARYGTFASAHNIQRAATVNELEVYNKLKDYYGGDVMSTFLAPLYPDASRNNLWILEKK